MKNTFIFIMICCIVSVASMQKGLVVDSADGRTYKTITIGNQTWMIENMMFNINGGLCDDKKDLVCKKNGRLYAWHVRDYVCPDGWHLPSILEWEKLFETVGGRDSAAVFLKTKKNNFWDNGKIKEGCEKGCFWALQERNTPFVVDLKNGFEYAGACRAYPIRCVKGEKKATKDIDNVLMDIYGSKENYRKKASQNFNWDKLTEQCDAENSKKGFRGIGDGLKLYFKENKEAVSAPK